MKSILIIDESPQFREYMRLKLEENKAEVTVAANTLEGVSKMKNQRPDLIILDYHLSKNGYMEVLREKRASVYTNKIPVIILAQKLEQRKLLELVPYNVQKVFTKPVKIDALFITLQEILGVPFKLDKSPGIVEVHVNEDIIFIEIAQGLNDDKLALLKFKIVELIALYEIRVPKVIIMFFDIKLTAEDMPKLTNLIDTVIHASRARLHYIRILTQDEFVKNFIASQKDYETIGVVDKLQDAVEGLLAVLAASQGDDSQKAELIGEKVLSSTGSAESESVTLRFEYEARARNVLSTAELRDILQNSKIATVDDDFVIRELIKGTFAKIGMEVKTYNDGLEFMEVMGKEDFDLVFLDLLMPRADGFMVLQTMQTRGLSFPVIVLSSVTQRDTVIRAFQMGTKSYISKPLKPVDLLKKAIEVLRPGL